jgi:hypothetical protein
MTMSLVVEARRNHSTTQKRSLERDIHKIWTEQRIENLRSDTKALIVTNWPEVLEKHEKTIVKLSVRGERR